MIVRVKSHRAATKLKRLCDIQWKFNLYEGNNFAEIDDEHAEAALAITGITRARHKHPLYKCWDAS